MRCTARLVRKDGRDLEEFQVLVSTKIPIARLSMKGTIILDFAGVRLLAVYRPAHLSTWRARHNM